MRGRIVRFSGVLRVLYAGDQAWVQAACTGDCNIRVELVLVYPVLLATSVLAFASAAIPVWQNRRARGKAT